MLTGDSVRPRTAVLVTVGTLQACMVGNEHTEYGVNATRGKVLWTKGPFNQAP